MSDLTAFLEARIAEDEAVARATDAPHWRPGDGNVSEGGLYGLEGDGSDEQKGWAIAWFELGETNPPRADGGPSISGANWSRNAHENSVHAARHDPARVLAECEAKRIIIDAAFDVAETIDGEWGCCHRAGDIRAGLDLGDRCYGPAAAEAFLAPLARVWAEHPDYAKAQW